MTDNRHIPVLLGETLAAFEELRSASDVLVDCTLGGAGHTSALLERFPDKRVLACDVDAAAIENARRRLAPMVQSDRLDFFHGNFSRIVDPEAKLPSSFAPPWAGALMDLGYSSNQLESAEYGMSFSVDAPLDMRLSRPPKGQTAWELLHESSAKELGDILKVYGEIPGAHRLAARIKGAMDAGNVRNSTASLAQFLEMAAGGRNKQAIHPATLVFQALRIAVNDELRALDHFLEGVILKLAPGGRLAVITFHSLEDRIAKRWGLKNANRIRQVHKKPIVAGPEELRLNPRSRSAKLRVYERTG